jgi:hypothetical protein
MKDEQVQSTLETWFEATDPQPPDARRTAVQVMAEVRQTRQRGHWLPISLFRHRVQIPTAADTLDDRPIPIPATNGHTTVIGRTQTMFSPAKAITAAALVFGIGGALLIAQPFGQPRGTTPGAATEVVPPPPAEFSGQIVCGPPIPPDGGGSETTVDIGDEGLVLTRYRGGTWRQTIDVTDPRLEGDIYHRWESDAYAVPDGETGPTVAAATWRIENDEGAWDGGHMELFLSDGTRLPSLTWFTGDGAYEGLTALMEVVGLEDGCTADIRGVIVEGVPAPVPYNPE